jgi:hypothetical protein
MSILVADLKVRRVSKQQLNNVDRRRCGVDRAAIAAPHQQRQAATMIQVAVGEHDRVDIIGMLIARQLVALVGVGALEHATVDEHLYLISRGQVA